VLIWHNHSTRAWAQRCLELYPDAERHVISTIGIAPSRRVTIHLYGTSEGFRELTGIELSDTLGVAFPGMNLIAIDCSKAEQHGTYANFRMTLRHEMIHIGFGRLQALTGSDVPLWFNEGVATWSTGRLRGTEPSQLVTAANVDALLPLASLSRSFPDSRTMRELAYQQSETAVEFIAGEYGPDAIPAIVSSMMDGRTFEEALHTITGGKDFEAAYVAHIRRRYPLLSLIYNRFSLFTLLALGVIVSYAVYRLRRRRIKKQWEEEEDDYGHIF